MNCLQITTTPGCWTKADGTSESVSIINEYRASATGEVILYKTRYAKADGTLITLGAGETITTGQCIPDERFYVQTTDTTTSTEYYYYGGNVGAAWQVHRYLHDDPADPLYMIPQIAQQSNNSSVTTLTAAWADRAALTYA